MSVLGWKPTRRLEMMIEGNEERRLDSNPKNELEDKEMMKNNKKEGFTNAVFDFFGCCGKNQKEKREQGGDHKPVAK